MSLLIKCFVVGLAIMGVFYKNLVLGSSSDRLNECMAKYPCTRVSMLGEKLCATLTIRPGFSIAIKYSNKRCFLQAQCLAGDKLKICKYGRCPHDGSCGSTTMNPSALVKKCSERFTCSIRPVEGEELCATFQLQPNFSVAFDLPNKNCTLLQQCLFGDEFNLCEVGKCPSDGSCGVPSGLPL